MELGRAGFPLYPSLQWVLSDARLQVVRPAPDTAILNGLSTAFQDPRLGLSGLAATTQGREGFATGTRCFT
jgi:hypothetical protein